MSEVALLVQSALAGNDQLVSQIDSQPEPQQSVEVSDSRHTKPAQSRTDKPKKNNVDRGSKSSSLNSLINPITGGI